MNVEGLLTRDQNIVRRIVGTISLFLRKPECEVLTNLATSARLSTPMATGAPREETIPAPTAQATGVAGRIWSNNGAPRPGIRATRWPARSTSALMKDVIRERRTIRSVVKTICVPSATLISRNLCTQTFPSVTENVPRRAPSANFMPSIWNSLIEWTTTSGRAQDIGPRRRLREDLRNSNSWCCQDSVWEGILALEDFITPSPF